MNNNKFHLIDPIDPNRDLISAFSEKKIARTILTAREYVKNGKPPTKSALVEKMGTSIEFNTSITDPDTLSGQVQKLERNMIESLDKIGFNVDREFSNPEQIVKGFSINPPRTSVDEHVDEKGRSLDNKFTINFGISKMDLEGDSQYKVIVRPAGKVDVDAIKKGGSKVKLSEDGKTISIYRKRPFMNARDAVEGLLNGTVGGAQLEKSNLLDEIRKSKRVFTKNSYFENLI